MALILRTRQPVAERAMAVPPPVTGIAAMTVSSDPAIAQLVSEFRSIQAAALQIRSKGKAVS